MNLLGVEYLVLPPDARWAGEEPLDGGEVTDVAVWRNPEALPRTWIVHRVECQEPIERLDRAQVRHRLSRMLYGAEALDLHKTAILDAPPETTQHVAPRDSPSESCHVVREATRSLVIDATLEQPGLLVLSNQYDRGWTVTVTQGEHQTQPKIWRANGVMQGVLLDAGRQRLEFHYTPRGFPAAATVTALAWLALLSLGVGQLVRRRQVK